MKSISINIVSYNTKALTLECLRSVYEQTQELAFEVIVVDNNSLDGSAEAIGQEFPQVRLLALKENIGFAPANNLAAKEAKGEWLLLLNPDTVVLDAAIQKLHRFAVNHPETGIFGGKTLFPDGSLNPTSCWNRPTPWSAFCRGIGLSTIFKGSRLFDPENIGAKHMDRPHAVDIVTGCFFLLQKSLWEQLNGFDPAFFMYAEEADLCLRARREGIRCMIDPEAAIIHYGGASEKVRADKMVRLFKAKGQLFSKHWSKSAARFGIFSLDLCAWMRMIAFRIIRCFSMKKVESEETWRTIWSRRKEWQSTLQIKRF